MTVTLKPKTEITVPRSIRRKAGLKPGDKLEFSVTNRTITIFPKLTPEEILNERADDLELRDPKVRSIIRESNRDFLAGKSRPMREFLAELRAEARPTPAKKRPRSG